MKKIAYYIILAFTLFDCSNVNNAGLVERTKTVNDLQCIIYPAKDVYKQSKHYSDDNAPEVIATFRNVSSMPLDLVFYAYYQYGDTKPFRPLLGSFRLKVIGSNGEDACERDTSHRLKPLILLTCEALFSKITLLCQESPEP